MNCWKQKLCAYLHDPPSKPVDIPRHQEAAKQRAATVGLDENDLKAFWKVCDHTAAAADRFPFPTHHHLSSVFDGVRAKFKHPLGGSEFGYADWFKSPEEAMAIEQSLQPALKDVEAFADDEDRDRALFFAHWRLWQPHCAEKDERFNFMPADTRLPDHTIWTHMQVVSALQGCVADEKLRPSFLMFQIGPVQEWIAQARSTRDLWSGSYLVSWLIGHGLKWLAWNLGPDHVIFPNLKGQPLFDLLLKSDLWDRVKIGADPVWKGFGHSDEALVTPNMPNKFLAIVPAAQAKEIADKVEEAIQAEWKQIAEHSLQFLNSRVTGDRIDSAKFHQQVEEFLQISWQVYPWRKSLNAVFEEAEKSASTHKALEKLRVIREMAEKHIPEEHRDARNYHDGKEQLNNAGFAWALHYGLTQWWLDGVRQTRMFAGGPASGWEGSRALKDYFTGREEALVTADWCKAARKMEDMMRLFKNDECLGAPMLIKRVWHVAHLRKVHDFKPEAFAFQDTREIARGDDDFNHLAWNEESSKGKYFAFLAMDGDEIGKWVAGEKAPPLGELLSSYPDGSGNPDGARAYFEKKSGIAAKTVEEFLKTPRPMSPSYHLQLSEAMSNFALYCVERIVKAHQGQLIYAGGDDVVAMLPANLAVKCAQALRLAFRGDKRLMETRGGNQFHVRCPGFVAIRKNLEDCLPEPACHAAFVVPGPCAEISAGIAVGHFTRARFSGWK
ncbi:MAG: type III-B CRISPR-associated protein Cas10/Cmr2 [Verrucomicrobia bacterium]|nr:type III-B CRISPR-associated protein Cas10/Cmr2 [Verrucomicrobiota bacterium]